MPGGRILVVEDEQSIASLIELYLKKEGFAVALAADGSSALETARELHPVLVILDVMLPGIDGLEVCRRLRSSDKRLPIIMLTARDGEIDRVLGLELGADDYVTKPFSPRELVARVKAVLRRAEVPDQEDEMLSLGDVTIDLLRRQTTAGGLSVELTPKEFDLLAFLVRNRGIVFTRERLLDRVWGYERPVDTRTVDSHVRSLRAKLGPQAALIKTMRGVGYKSDL